MPLEFTRVLPDPIGGVILTAGRTFRGCGMGRGCARRRLEVRSDIAAGRGDGTADRLGGTFSTRGSRSAIEKQMASTPGPRPLKCRRSLRSGVTVLRSWRSPARPVVPDSFAICRL